MLRTLWITIFAVSVLASGISSTTSETTSTSTTTLSHPANTSDSAVATTESVTSTVRYERNETTPHVEISSELSKRVSRNNETVTSENEKNEKDCHMTEETKDMLNCFVVPSDVASPELTTNLSQENRMNKTKQEISKFNDTYPPKIFPHGKDVKSIDEADEATRRRLNLSFYATFSPAEVEAASSPTAQNNSDRKNTSVKSLATDTNNVRNTSLKSDSEMAQKSKNEEGTSQETIMLTMVFTLAIAIAAIYAGMIAWKRYLEYRYSHRQLLDNDSEFDANDLHNFEL